MNPVRRICTNSLLVRQNIRFCTGSRGDGITDVPRNLRVEIKPTGGETKGGAAGGQEIERSARRMVSFR
jgi:hypothetical protein